MSDSGDSASGGETAKRARWSLVGSPVDVVAYAALACATAGALLAQTARTIEQQLFTSCLPSFDVADYLNRGLDLVGDAQRGELLHGVFLPNVHPPGHPLYLATLSVLGADSLEAFSLGMLPIWLLALAMIVAWGWRVARDQGALCGALAALICALSSEHQRLALAPMTENLAFLTTMLVLVAATRITSSRGALVTGVAVLGASWVRYSAAPLLLLPLAAHLVWETRGWGWRSRGWRLLGLFGPTALGFGLWAALRPGVAGELRKFFRNVDSGLPFWSEENLLWVPKTLGSELWTSPMLVAVLAALGLFGVVLAWRPAAVDAPWRGPARLVQLALLTGLLAVAVHPYKLARAMHGVVPLLALAAIVPGMALQHASARRVVAFGGAVAVGITLAVGGALGDAEETGARAECVPTPNFDASIAQLLTWTADLDSVTVSGANELMSRHAARLFLRMAEPGRAVSVADPLAPECVEEVGLPPSEACLPGALGRALSEPSSGLVVLWKNQREHSARGRGGGTVRPPRTGRHWSVRSGEIAIWRVEQTAGVLIGELSLGASGAGKLVVYKRGD